MEKLTDFIKPDMKFQDIANEETPERIDRMLYELKFLKRIFERIMETPPGKLKDFNPIESHYEIAKAIDIVFHKDNIVQRAIIFDMTVLALEDACKSICAKLLLYRDDHARRNN